MAIAFGNIKNKITQCVVKIVYTIGGNKKKQKSKPPAKHIVYYSPMLNQNPTHLELSSI